MATKSKNISLKFKDNTSNLYTKQDLKNDKLSKIKISLQKSKIKNKKAIISLNKRVYKNKQTTDFINTSFSELIKSNPNYTIPKFFEVYENLFYNIPKKGEKSHNSLIVQSQEYINDYNDPKEFIIDKLLENLEKKDEELNLKQNPEPKENVFYPNGTFLRTHGWNAEVVEGVPQGLPIWVMQEGLKREFKSYDVYKIVKRALGFTNMAYDTDKQELLGDKDTDIVEMVHVSDLNSIPTGKDINTDSDLNVPSGPDREINTSLANILDYFAADVTCLESPLDITSDVSAEDTCLIRHWTLDGTRTTSRRLESGETQRVYWRKDNPSFDITDRTLGVNSLILQQQISGENDGLFEKTGLLEFKYIHPAGKPTEVFNYEEQVGNIASDLVGGCTDPTAFNYDSNASFDDDSCVPVIYGCATEGYANSDPEANTDDGSCYGIG